MLEACLGLYRRLGNQVEVAATLSTLSLARLQAGDAVGAEASEREALALFRDPRRTQRRGHRAAAPRADRRLCRRRRTGRFQLERMSAHRASPSRTARSRAKPNCGWAKTPSSRADQTTRAGICERSLAICREAGDRRGEAHALGWLGKADLEAGDVDEARRRLRRGLLQLPRFRDARGTGRLPGRSRRTGAAIGRCEPWRSPCRRGRAVPGAAGLDALAERAVALADPARFTALMSPRPALRYSLGSRSHYGTERRSG